METTLNLLDLGFIALTLIFVATAFFRGFVKEIFALTGWVVSFVGSYLLAPLASNLFNDYSQNKLVTDIAARSIIFLIIFIVFSFSTSGLSDELRKKIPKSFDCSLGVFYGLIKTLIVFGFLYAITINSLGFLSGKNIDENSPQFPKFLKEAKCHDILKGSADVLNPAVELFFDSVVKNFDQVVPRQKTDLDDKIDEVSKMESSADEEPVNDTGYNKKDIEKMNHLIEIIDK
jgi:uncharacterized membrane protein required for colicin V production